MVVGLECSYRAEFWGNFSVWVGFVGKMNSPDFFLTPDGLTKNLLRR